MKGLPLAPGTEVVANDLCLIEALRAAGWQETLVAGRLIALIRRYPAIVDGAFVIIAWVGIKLLIEYAHQEGWIGFEVPKWLSLGLIVVIFTLAFVYARRHEHLLPEAEPSTDLLERVSEDRS